MATRRKGKRKPSKAATDRAFSEVHENEPAIVARTRRKKGAAAAERQKKRIALEKARDSDRRKRRRA
ncbi:MAG: hypothetical protein GY906_24320 [bacterium]|nr:hypothetical protein [bacterium]